MLISVAREASELAARLAHARTFAFDFETTGLSWVHDQAVGYSVALPSGESWYVPLWESHRPHLSLPEALAPLRAAMAQPRWVVGHNLKFDLHWARKVGCEAHPEARLLDTLIAAQLLREDRSNALKTLARDYLEYDDLHDFDDVLREARDLRAAELTALRAERDSHKRKSEWYSDLKARVEALAALPVTAATVPLRHLADYGAKDAKLTIELAQFLLPMLKDEGLDRILWDEEMPFLRVLYEMEARGVLVDVPAVEMVSASFDARITAAEAELDALVAETGYAPTDAKGKAVEFNPGSTKQLAELLYDTLGLKPTGRKTASGGDQLDAIALSMLRESYPEVTLLHRILGYRDLVKTRSTYFEPLLKLHQDGVIHADFRQTGTVTGRLSCSDPNLQNQPNDPAIRNLWIARPGHTLWDADYSQAELRMVAHLSQDPMLLKVYREGLDIHALTASLLWGVPLSEVTKAQRTRAKPINFGMLYRMGPQLLADTSTYDYGVPLSSVEARGFIDDWYAAYEGVRPWQERVLNEARATRVATNLYGRRRHLDDLLSMEAEVGRSGRPYYPKRGRAERQCINFHVQGSVGVLVKLAQIALRKALAPLGAYQLVQVHDEILGECPEGAEPEVKRVVEETMRSVVNLSVPFAAECSFGKKWGEAK